MKNMLMQPIVCGRSGECFPLKISPPNTRWQRVYFAPGAPGQTHLKIFVFRWRTRAGRYGTSRELHLTALKGFFLGVRF